ncbi:hypothetical protein SAMN05192558_104431 [Actinokineospora alba]|uniref:DUF6875 domain-containing protein n=1 Tax=Actinokineospora alba TaxID=504798 RepID=A0A1H0M606_9PSEU|nr:hypothetical protein [Actinokineospora alba]TDP67602.1 hypothetical protein C8E96_3148 [Actinokineospora alba]SDI44686.1 hypothetical protein SAMN05421871_10529 [Actinokineospora alba]SDO75942.1 hypothetical protein SAMN05192558_104431 [Actinokineospora alba]
MNGDNHLFVWTADEIARGEIPAEHARELTEVLRWSQDFLVSPHPDLGRGGPVCPYTQPSLRRDLFYIAVPRDPRADLSKTVARLRSWHERLSTGLDEEERELLAVLIVLPGLDYTDSTELDLLQRKAKDDFVANGLMIGQFHPVCDEPGLWNPSFRPLRAPVPLLAVRRMLVFDLLFLVGDLGHADSYLRRFAPAIPARVRHQLVTRLVSTDSREALSA